MSSETDLCLIANPATGDIFWVPSKAPYTSSCDPHHRMLVIVPCRSRHKVGNMLHAIIMAGGSGTRFWPASRRRAPSSFLLSLETDHVTEPFRDSVMSSLLRDK